MREEKAESPPGHLVVQGLTKRYGDRVAVDNASFECRPGTVTAFLGPNGSGKSTTLRMIVGHARATAGMALFDGESIRSMTDPGTKLGVLLDASAQHPGRSVWETARLSSLLIGVSKRRTKDCLAGVGLDRVHRKALGSLSLGMRQRLGLALAILGSPQFLILDEPANGLDPEGIRWLREFIVGFAHSGGTVLVSSHQLSEAQSMADHILVIDRGVVKPATSVLRPDASSTCLVVTADDRAFVSYLREREVSVTSKPGITPLEVRASRARTGQLASAAGIALLLLTDAPTRSFEDDFLDATSGEFVGLSGEALLQLTNRGSR